MSNCLPILNQPALCALIIPPAASYQTFSSLSSISMRLSSKKRVENTKLQTQHGIIPDIIQLQHGIKPSHTLLQCEIQHTILQHWIIPNTGSY